MTGETHPMRASFRRVGRAALLTAALTLLPALPAHAVTGPAPSDSTWSFTARLDIGDGERACTGALIDPEWLLTAASCFLDDPAGADKVTAGAPRQATRAVIGRTDLTTTAGVERTVVDLVPREDRDLVLARLSFPVAGIAPARIAAAPADAGQRLTSTGYGRTTDEWAPVKVHHGTFTAAAPTGVDVPVTGDAGASICAGDAGAPLFQSSGDTTKILAVASRSDQGGCFGIAPEQTSTAAVGARTDDIADWVDATVTAARGRVGVVDFNGDGIEDVSIGDPKATVNAVAEAGAVRVVYGGGKGTAQLDQSASFVPGDAEAGDRFGHALATVDNNQDGYTDLVVGTPYEDATTTVTDVGTVTVIYGAPAGLGTGRTSDNYVQGDGSGAIKAAKKEKGDLLGATLAAGRTREGSPYIVIGSPGDAVGGKANAGTVFYLRGTSSVAIAQGTGMSGGPEAGDRVGASVAADANNIAVGAPGEDIDAIADAGAVWVFAHPAQTTGQPLERANINQNLDNVAGGSEAGDVLGASVALAEDGASGNSVLAVGVPGEALTAGNGTVAKNAGGIVTFDLPRSGSWTERRVITQDSEDVVGGIEAGDRFGETLQAVNLSPNTTPTWQTLQLVAGSPGEAQGSVAAAGAVHTMTLVGAPGPHNDVVFAGHNGLPGAPTANHRIGQTIAVSSTSVYVGLPTAAGGGAAYAVPWQNLTSRSATGTDLPVTTHQPGNGGIPAGGKAFGSAIR
ncbi:hypothetical protein SUDANB15_07153 [Streptomyces sp. enrichment culture]